MIKEFQLPPNLINFCSLNTKVAKSASHQNVRLSVKLSVSVHYNFNKQILFSLSSYPPLLLHLLNTEIIRFLLLYYYTSIRLQTYQRQFHRLYWLDFLFTMTGCLPEAIGGSENSPFNSFIFSPEDRRTQYILCSNRRRFDSLFLIQFHVSVLWRCVKNM